MKLGNLLIVFICCFTLSLTVEAQYQFTLEQKLDCTDIKNQSKTGTCWSFASSSFLESELLRMGKGSYDLSEMYVVRNIYKDKARNYMLRQGKANFSQGSLAHDLLRVMSTGGIVPEQVYSGLVDGALAHNHSEMEKGMKGFLDGVGAQKALSNKWDDALSAILDVYLGEAPSKFTYNGKAYTPVEFAKSLEINPSEYRHFTSFSHHPFESSFILEIPDNFSNGSFENIPLDQLMKIIDDALAAGYSLVWDGDVSEAGFSSKEGMAVLPEDEAREDLFTAPGKEVMVTQANRQAAFESLETTDDHLMHIVGTSRDQVGNKYYVIKNSWGERGPAAGYLHMSEAYMKMKTVSITVHESAVKN